MRGDGETPQPDGAARRRVEPAHRGGGGGAGGEAARQQQVWPGREDDFAGQPGRQLVGGRGHLQGERSRGPRLRRSGRGACRRDRVSRPGPSRPGARGRPGLARAVRRAGRHQQGQAIAAAPAAAGRPAGPAAGGIAAARGRRRRPAAPRRRPGRAPVPLGGVARGTASSSRSQMRRQGFSPTLASLAQRAGPGPESRHLPQAMLPLPTARPATPTTATPPASGPATRARWSPGPRSATRVRWRHPGPPGRPPGPATTVGRLDHGPPRPHFPRTVRVSGAFCPFRRTAAGKVAGGAAGG